MWKCDHTEFASDGALEHFYTQVQTLEGQRELNVLLTGSMAGSVRYEDL